MLIKDRIIESIKVKEKMLLSANILGTIDKVHELITSAYCSGGKVLFCGNGGSAADAQHLAAELSGRFYKTRKPLYAEALHCNTSYLTAVANDFSFDDIYARIIEAAGNKGDVLIAISTSGNSPNVVNAVEKANEKGMITAGLTGQEGGRLASVCRYLIRVPSMDTPRIQECHILIGHIICEQVEADMFTEAQA